MKSWFTVKLFVQVIRILIPVTFFIIANVADVLFANAIAGVMTILVLTSYLFEHYITE